MGFNIMVYEKLPDGSMKNRNDLWDSHKWHGEYEIYSAITEGDVDGYLPGGRKYWDENIYYLRPKDVNAVEIAVEKVLNELDCNHEVFRALVKVLKENENLYIYPSC